MSIGVSEASLADIAAVTNKNDDGMFGGNSAWWIIVLLLFGWGGRGFGGSVTAESVNLDNFVTRKEFDELKASIASQPTSKKTKNNLTEATDNG